MECDDLSSLWISVRGKSPANICHTQFVLDRGTL